MLPPFISFRFLATNASEKLFNQFHVFELYSVLVHRVSFALSAPMLNELVGVVSFH